MGMGDMFAGVFDSFSGAGSSISDLFSSGEANLDTLDAAQSLNDAQDITGADEANLINSGWGDQRTIGATEEAGLIDNHWGSDSGGSLFSGKNLAGALQAGAKGLAASQGNSPKIGLGLDATSMRSSLSPSRFPAGNTAGKASVDLGALERTWIDRMKLFSDIRRETEAKFPQLPKGMKG
jgi:hypothetical protein